MTRCAWVFFPDARSGAAAVVSSEGELLVIGGTSALPRPLATFERLQVFPKFLSESNQGSVAALRRNHVLKGCREVGFVNNLVSQSLRATTLKTHGSVLAATDSESLASLRCNPSVLSCSPVCNSVQGWEEQGEQGLAMGEWRVAGVMPYPATMCAAVWLTPDVTPKTGYTSAET